MNPKAICLVGHENWGKSKTLYHLVGKSTHRGWITVNGFDIFVRHMSNDDLIDSFINFLENLRVKAKPLIVVALCPNFSDIEAHTEEILEELHRKGYELYFWVLLHQYNSPHGNSPHEIDEIELARLREYGSVEVFRDQVEAHERARIFNNYILNILNE